MLTHSNGMIGFPLRLLAREVFDKISLRCGKQYVALITGEERIMPENPKYWVCTVEAMPINLTFDFVAIDEIQLCADLDRGHIFTNRLLNLRGKKETIFLGSSSIKKIITNILPDVEFLSRKRLSQLKYVDSRKINKIQPRSAIVCFSVEEVYSIAEIIRREKGGAAIVTGGLSPKTRNSQVNLYQSGEVDYLVATDAIGMGLNLDLSNVCFASLTKFDGFNHRKLFVNELAQIAGRAGRYTTNGTFGTTAGCEALSSDLIYNIENHNFLDIKKTEYENLEVQSSFNKSKRNIWLLPSDKVIGKTKSFVDYQNDATAKDIKLALREGFRSIEHVKRYTTTGMGTDQGKLGNMHALGIISETTSSKMGELGTTTFRPPYTPLTFGTIVGRNVGEYFDIFRKTPIHDWHVENKAEFENVGQWKRAWYYPKDGETMHEAVQRESKAARDSAGILDASTLGKIDIQGTDASEFLNRVYTNAWSKLAIGKCRYGLMLNEDGMVYDDGVTTRLDENHYLMTTTTGGAATVLGKLEDYLQTEWPELDVYLTSVTDHYATVSVCGPNSKKIVSQVISDLDFSDEKFPHMSFKNAKIGKIKCRVMRISFTGEQSYEINVQSNYGKSVWEKCMEVGKEFNITPYGTETMHLLRAEKGFIIVGQDTDATMTPIDLQMDWIVSKKKYDFIGKRSLYRSDTIKEDRKQLVGLITEDPKEVLEEGAQIVADINKSPVEMLGHVTSSYYSPNLNKSIALGVVRGGKKMMGQKLIIPMPNKKINVVVADPVFLDKENKRLNA